MVQMSGALFLSSSLKVLKVPESVKIDDFLLSVCLLLVDFAFF